ncbi:hypothetical protein Q1695_008950 [Nippostrongylus brasiliensis]|nr:hypothetical protein Q1695_008950 [Nippostrongylus brasiliensis]
MIIVVTIFVVHVLAWKVVFLVTVSMTVTGERISPAEELANRLSGLSSRSGGGDALRFDDVLMKEIETGANEFDSANMLDQNGVRELIFETAKEVVVTDEHRQVATRPLLDAFKQDINRFAENSANSKDSFISVANVYRVLSNSPPEVRKCFNVAVMERLRAASNSPVGSISCRLLTKYLTTCSRRSVQRLFLQSNVKSIDYITANEFLDFVLKNIASRLPWDGKDSSFYYSVYIERCVFFHFDPQRTGKVPIMVISVEKRLSIHNLVIVPTFWCSISRFNRVLEQFRICDRDLSGMISLDECQYLRGGNITPLFLQRVYACEMLYGDRQTLEMDFRLFVDLDLAISLRSQPASIRWLFRVLDMREDGVLDRDEIKQMADSMLENLAAKDYPMYNLNADDIVDEVIDMIKPADADGITVDDVIASNMAEVAFGMLIDCGRFCRYESREEEVV